MNSTDINRLTIVPFAFPYDYLAPLKDAPALGSEPVVNLLRYTAEFMDQVAWDDGTDATDFGWIVAASQTYLEAANLAELEQENAAYGEEYAGQRRLWGVIQAADALAALAGWGHLRACTALSALAPR